MLIQSDCRGGPRHMSAAARKRIAEAQRAKWARVLAEKAKAAAGHAIEGRRLRAFFLAATRNRRGCARSWWRTHNSPALKSDEFATACQQAPPGGRPAIWWIRLEERCASSVVCARLMPLSRFLTISVLPVRVAHVPIDFRQIRDAQVLAVPFYSLAARTDRQVAHLDHFGERRAIIEVRAAF